MKTASKEGTFWLRKSIDWAHQASKPPCISPLPPTKKGPWFSLAKQPPRRKVLRDAAVLRSCQKDNVGAAHNGRHGYSFKTSNKKFMEDIRFTGTIFRGNKESLWSKYPHCLCIQFNPPNWGFYAKRLEPKLSQYLPLNSTPFLMHSLQILWSTTPFLCIGYKEMDGCSTFAG